MTNLASCSANLRAVASPIPLVLAPLQTKLSTRTYVNLQIALAVRRPRLFFAACSSEPYTLRAEDFLCRLRAARLVARHDTAHCLSDVKR